MGYRNFCSEATEISVTHTTEISVKSSARAEETSLICSMKMEISRFAVLKEKVKDYPSVLTQVNSTSGQINIAFSP